MLNPKTNDLAVLTDFLEHEHRRFESIRHAREAIMRIGSLMHAETQAREALESAEADLAWTRAKVEAIEASIPTAQEMARRKIEAVRAELEAAIKVMRQRQMDEDKRLDAAIAEKRATLGTLMAHVEALRARGVEVAARR